MTHRVMGLLVALACGTPLAAHAQTDSTLQVALRLATEGQGDSARALVRAALRSTSTADSLYPQVLFTAGAVASDADSARMYYRRVSIEFSASAWADDALLRLAQLAFAAGDYGAAAHTAERVVLDYPLSDVRADAAYWAARAELEGGNQPEGCRYLGTAADAAADNVELLNRVNYYRQRCTAVQAADSQRAPAVTPAAGAGFAVQVAAVSNVTSADEVMRTLKAAGYDPRVVRDDDGLWKVRVGRFRTREEAQQLARDLRAKLGGQPFVVEER